MQQFLVSSIYSQQDNSLIQQNQTGRIHLNPFSIQYTLYPYCRLVYSIPCIHILYQYPVYPVSILQTSIQYTFYIYSRLVSSIPCIHILDQYTVYPVSIFQTGIQYILYPYSKKCKVMHIGPIKHILHFVIKKKTLDLLFTKH